MLHHEKFLREIRMLQAFQQGAIYLLRHDLQNFLPRIPVIN